MEFTETEQEILVNAWLLAREGKGQVLEDWAEPEAQQLADAGWLERRHGRRERGHVLVLDSAGRVCARHERTTAHRPGGHELMADRPYRLITTDDPNRTFGEALDAGGVRYFASMLAAANAFAKATERFKTVVYDDGCTARELNRNEQRLLENACAKRGLRWRRSRIG